MSMAYFAGIPGKIKILVDRLNATRAANLDKLDVLLSTRATSTEVAKAAAWTQPLADKINLNLDKKVSESGAVFKSIIITSTSAGNWTIPPKIKHGGVKVSMIGGGGSGSRQTGSGQAGGGGEACQDSWYSFSGGEITAGQIARQCGAGGAGKTTTGSGNDGLPTTFGLWSVEGGKGGSSVGTASRTGTMGGFTDDNVRFTNGDSYGGPHGDLCGITDDEYLGGGGGLRFNPSSPRGTYIGRDGSGYGAGSYARTNNTNSNAGLQGAILLQWEETP